MIAWKTGALIFFALPVFASCSAQRFTKTVDKVDLERFMGDWYVMAYRPLWVEKDAYNALEQYTYDREKERIAISYTFNKGSFDGKKKHYPQTGEVLNKETNAHWLVSPFWPLKFDYLVVALDEEAYQWTVIGVPSGKYIWLMARDNQMLVEEIRSIMA